MPKNVNVTPEIPLSTASLDGIYVPDSLTHLQARLTIQQGRTLKRLYLALHEGHATLTDGRHVDSHADAFRWLLEAIDGARPASDVRAFARQAEPV